MECNKEEAVRAKDIAEKKMQLKDYIGARKIALKAQQLFPDLDNISHMLTVCEVHCAASAKVNGWEDWYGVLQVDSTSDELSIKKQYRKLALLLHPDKNKFAGAEAAFKLIGEANRTLSDKARRSLYDMKRRTSVGFAASRPQPNGNNFDKMVKKFRSDAGSKSTNLNQQERQPQQAAGGQTFWTICTFCSIRYQYFRNVMLRNIRCQNCNKTFVAYELKMKGAMMGMNHPVFSGQGTCKTSQQCHTGDACFSRGFGVNAGDGPRVSESSKVGNNIEPGDRVINNAKVENQVHSDPQKEKELKFEKVELKEVNNNREQAGKPSANLKRKRTRKKIVESSDTDIEEVMTEKTDNLAAKDVDTSKKLGPRRSTRQKQNVAYNEDISDDDFAVPKRSRKDSLSHDVDQNSRMFLNGNALEVRMPADGAHDKKERKEDIKCGENLQNGHVETRNQKINPTTQEEAGSDDASELGTNSKSSSVILDPDPCSYPDPEFCDFEKRRVSSAFAVGQIWALFDDIDGMPRFYARIKNVFPPGLKVQYTWLEHVPVGQTEDWSKNELPVACGTFKPGISQITKDLPMFSHPMSWEKIARKNYLIQPRKDEVWALYKGWNINWSSNPQKHKPFEYEIVLVLSDYTKGLGIGVAPLIRVESFVSLFTTTVNDGTGKLQIPPHEMLRFSHLVPSYRMTGNEREGIPEGFYELDPASLPLCFAENFPSTSLDLAKAKVGDRGAKVSNPIPKPPQIEKARAFLDKERKSSEENILKNQHPRKIDISTEDVSGTNKNSQGRRKTATSEAEKHACSETGLPKSQENQKNLGSCRRTRGATRNHSGSASSSHNIEFHNFQLERSDDKFKNGQIWALYSDIDRIPRFYALIKGINSDVHKARVIWLEACPMLDKEIKWFDKDLPFGCGTFKLSIGRSNRETSVTLAKFSHLVRAEAAEKKHQYYIYPRAGEVWAMYRNWSADWEESDMTSCEYDLVEVITSTSSVIQVLLLVKVENFKAIFTHVESNGAMAIMEVPQNELLRFSHRVPSFRLTKADHASLKGYWELDTLSVPKAYVVPVNN